MSMVRYSRKELNEKFSDKQDAEIERLLAKGTVPDDQLDLSDIPEITDWSNVVLHNQFYRPYAIRLYELLIQWRSTGKTPIFNLSIFRQQLGVEEQQYKTMSNFKTYVLEFALEQVNKFTDITAKYQQHKEGRSISGLSFTLKQKKVGTTNSKSPRPTDLFSKLTDKQRHVFANKLSELPDMNKYSQGTESYAQFAVRIAEMLQDQKKFEELLPYLKKVGFNAK